MSGCAKIKKLPGVKKRQKQKTDRNSSVLKLNTRKQNQNQDFLTNIKKKLIFFKIKF